MHRTTSVIKPFGWALAAWRSSLFHHGTLLTPACNLTDCLLCLSPTTWSIVFSFAWGCLPSFWLEADTVFLTKNLAHQGKKQHKNASQTSTLATSKCVHFRNSVDTCFYATLKATWLFDRNWRVHWQVGSVHCVVQLCHLLLPWWLSHIAHSSFFQEWTKQSIVQCVHQPKVKLSMKRMTRNINLQMILLFEGCVSTSQTLFRDKL